MSRHRLTDLVRTCVCLILESDRPVRGIVGGTEQTKTQVITEIVPGEPHNSMVGPLGHVDQFVSEEFWLCTCHDLFE